MSSIRNAVDCVDQVCPCVNVSPQFASSKLCDEQILSFTPQGGYRLLSGPNNQKFFFDNGKCY